MKPGVIIAVLLVLGVFVYAFAVNYQQYKHPVTATSTPEYVTYTSESAKITFAYPPTYQVDTHIEGNAERNWPVIVLMDKVAAANIPQGGEAPPSIAIAAYPNPEGLSVEQWIKGDARSNGKLAVQDGGLGSTTVGGLSGMAYRYSGLYENSATVVARGDTIYMFSVGWLTAEDPIRADFDELLKTVTFN